VLQYYQLHVTTVLVRKQFPWLS